MGFDQGASVEEEIAEGQDLLREKTLELPSRRSDPGLARRPDQVLDRLRLAEVETPVQERPFGELARPRGARAGREDRAQREVGDERSPVTVDRDDVLPGEARWSEHGEHQDLVDRLLRTRRVKAREPRAVRRLEVDGTSALPGAEDAPGDRHRLAPAQSDDRNRGRPRGRCQRGDRVLDVGRHAGRLADPADPTWMAGVHSLRRKPADLKLDEPWRAAVVGSASSGFYAVRAAARSMNHCWAMVSKLFVSQ